MDNRRFSRISHGQMRFWSPLPADELVRLLRELPMPRGGDVLDIGCGDGEVALELATWHGARVTGVDRNPEAIERCRARVAGDFFVEELRPERFGPASFDVIVSIGASPGLPRVLEDMGPSLRRPGRVLIGDVHFRRRPSDVYLAFLGGAGTPTPTLDDHHAALREHGFTVERSLVASQADWDRYEDEYDANMVAHLASHPDDPDAAELEDRRRAWRAMYLAHGRGTMGFALHQARLAGEE